MYNRYWKGCVWNVKPSARITYKCHLKMENKFYARYSLVLRYQPNCHWKDNNSARMSKSQEDFGDGLFDNLPKKALENMTKHFHISKNKFQFFIKIQFFHKNCFQRCLQNFVRVWFCGTRLCKIDILNKRRSAT